MNARIIIWGSLFVLGMFMIQDCSKSSINELPGWYQVIPTEVCCGNLLLLSQTIANQNTGLQDEQLAAVNWNEWRDRVSTSSFEVRLRYANQDYPCIQICNRDHASPVEILAVR